ncbi:hypothetical protein F5B18DRAFT_653671 [Nemania serpens]|nr:hypothetical protein F5B18DRAFT_653671 [Nemania serpens]
MAHGLTVIQAHGLTVIQAHSLRMERSPPCLGTGSSLVWLQDDFLGDWETGTALYDSIDVIPPLFIH